MRHIVTVLLVLVGIVNLLPLAGVLGAPQLESLYGVAISEPNLVLLLRHRAVLLGLVGALLIYAAGRPAHRPAAIIAALVSMLSFVALAALAEYNAYIHTVVVVDVVASLALALAGFLQWQQSNRGHP